MIVATVQRYAAHDAEQGADADRGHADGDGRPVRRAHALRPAARASDAARERRARSAGRGSRVRLGLGAGVPQSLGAARARRRGARDRAVELGTAIAWAFGRSPLLTAVTALDLDEMSGGRFVLGLGTGTRRMRTDWLGAPAERPARRLRETVEAIRAVWAAAEAGAVEYEGELVRLERAARTGGPASVAPRSRSTSRRSTRGWRARPGPSRTASSRIRWRPSATSTR